MLGNNITMTDALMVTVFSMGIVFAALAVISGILSLFIHFEKTEGKEKKAVTDKVKKERKTTDDEEIIAVITAALADFLGKRTDQLIVRNIVNVTGNEPEWAKAGRLEIMKSGGLK